MELVLAHDLRSLKPAEFSAAFADLGTFLPLVLGLVLIAGMDPVGLLYGFGAFALFTAVVYRRPIPVQPMKAVAAMGIAGLVTQDVLIATGVMMGLILIVLSRTARIEQFKQWIPKTVLHGMRVALAISLIVSVLSLMPTNYMGVALLLALLIGLQFTPLKPISTVVVIVIGVIFYSSGLPDTGLPIGWTWPSWTLPSLPSYQVAAIETLLPQLALTLTNALILTAVIAKEYFPEDVQSGRLTEQRFALTSGVANLCLAPLGAMPMCHGAGGLVAHRAMGSRTGWSIAVFGVACVAIAGLFGAQAGVVLLAIPAEVLVTLVVYAAWVLADPRALVKVRPSCQVVIALMIPFVWFGGLFAALLAGLIIEKVRVRWVKPVSA